MTEPKQQTLRAKRGDTKIWTITFDQAVSGYVEIWFTIRDGWATTEVDDADAISQKTLSGGGIATTGTYTADVEFSDVDALAWQKASYQYDIQIRTAQGRIFTTQYGSLMITPDATRSTAAP